MKQKAITLLYHDVVSGQNPDASGFSGPNSAEYTITTSEFDNHLRAIKGTLKGQVISALNLFDNKYTSPPVLFSFDDGGVGAYENIAPMLEAYGWRGCFFITTDRIGDPTFLNRQQIKNLYSRGHVIGSHSCSHPRNMALLNREKIIDEWKYSLQALSDIVGEEINIASIPSGFYSRKIAEAAESCGVKILFTSEPKQSISKIGACFVVGRFSIKRGMNAKTPESFVAGNISLRLRQYLYWNLKKTAKKFSGPIYPWIRSVYLSNK